MNADVSTSALLVMDMQHDIVSPEGRFGSGGLGAAVAEAGTIPNAAAALAAARAAGMTVVHVGVEIRDGMSPNTTAGLFAAVVENGICMPGDPGTDFASEVAPVAGELVVMKAAVSAFAGTELDAHLRNRGIRNLALAGVMTNFVVEGTARQAVDMGYAVTILTDACGSSTPEMHAFSLNVLEMLTAQETTADFAAAL